MDKKFHSKGEKNYKKELNANSATKNSAITEMENYLDGLNSILEKLEGSVKLKTN